jgi:ribosomal protein L37AE/L43A
MTVLNLQTLRAQLLDAKQHRGQDPTGWGRLIAEMTSRLSHADMPSHLPEGATASSVARMTVLEPGWRVSARFVCSGCSAPALLHPYTNHIWGCLVCGTTTHCVAVFFRPSMASFAS